MKTILVVDEDEARAWRIAYSILGERRYNTLFAGGYSDVFYIVQRIIPHLMIFYFKDTPEKGLACYDKVAAMSSFTSVPTIFISARNEQIELEAQRRNLVLLEPTLEIRELLDIVDQLMI